ncbi:MAG: alpha/beta hydrolase [Clostridia bacterium]|nr:alpha/beta hydrolase [Clostridia bacterium]
MIYVLIPLILLIVLTLFASLYAFLRGSTRRDRTELFKASTVAPSGRYKFRDRMQLGVDWYESQPKRELHITSRDGLPLAAELIEAENPVGLVVAVHGFRSWPAREYALIAKHLYDEGYTVLYPYMRAHRKSGGKYITFGVKERYDIAAWAKLLSDQRPDLPLFLYGQSMGGATVIMASGLDLPANTRGVIADSAYFSPKDVIGTALVQSYKVPVFPMLPAMDLWARIIAGYSVTATTCQEALDKTKLPFLFIHGTEDELVPYAMGLQNFEHCHTEKQMLTVEGAAHCASYYVDPVQYISYLDGFLKKYGQVPLH